MIRLWDKIRDWALLFGLVFLSLFFLLSANEPMLRGLRARAIETSAGVESWFAWMSDYIHAIEENQDLRNENFRLSGEVAVTRTAITENRQLKELLGLLDSVSVDVVPARIISKDITRERNMILLNVGRRDGIETGMAVADARGILGKVVLVGDRYAQVMTYLNTDFFTPVKILETDSDGMLHWDGEQFDRLLLEHVVRSQPVAPGESVVTSGYSTVFPPGLPVGVVDSVVVRPGMTTWEIFVRPVARLDNATYAFVIRTKPEPERIEISF